MKNREVVLCIRMLLSLLLFLSLGSGAYAQSVNDPEQDLSVTFSTKREGKGPGSVAGVVKNTSANAYPCVRIEFDLKTRFDLREPGQNSQHLGVLPVEVQDLRPHGERDYQQPLPFPAGIGIKSVTACSGPPAEKLPDEESPDFPEIPSFTVTPGRIEAGQAATLRWRTENSESVFVGERNPEWPQDSSEAIRAPRSVELAGSLQVSPSQAVTYRLEAKKGAKSAVKDVTVEVVASAPEPAATCSIAGRLSGKLQWDTKDDRGQPVSFTLTHMFMTTPGTDQPVSARVQGRDYVFANVPAGRTYRVVPGSFRSRPRERSVSCRPNTSRRGVDFEITGPPSSG